ncbi:MAG: hypothetical protein WBM17_10705, partial [Anaerolineales bacterium]
SQILGQEVSEEAVEMLCDPKYIQPHEMEQAAQLIVELFEKYAKENILTGNDLLIIKQDIAQRLTSLAFRRISNKTAPTLLQACSFSTKTVLKILIRSILGKTKRMVFG